MKNDKRKVVKIEKKDGRYGEKLVYHLECNYCKKIFSIPTKRYNQGVGKYCSTKCQKNSNIGEGNPNYKHGKQQGLLEWSAIRKKELEIKGNKCQLCGFNKHPEIIEAHHKIPKTKGGKNTSINCLLVCPNCHKLIHRGIIDTKGNSLKEKGKGIHNY